MTDAPALRREALGARPWEETAPGVRRRVVQGERMTLLTYRFDPGGRFPRHRHAQEQMVLVLEGSVTFASPDRAVMLDAGDALVIPPDLPHEAVAGPAGAALVSVVAPARAAEGGYTLEA